MSRRKRLDLLLVERGLVESRNKAQALIMEGKVLVNDKPITKPGTAVPQDAEIRVKEVLPYVSRGGLKLEGALEDFGIDVEGFVALDIGASTGGFTHCLLKKGAKKVYAVDVAYGVIHPTLRADERVVLIERKNARYLKFEDIGEQVDIATIDVSFISIRKIIPNLWDIIKSGGFLLPLVKPQFEVGKGEVEKGGVVRSKEKIERVLSEIEAFLNHQGYRVIGVKPSRVKGAKKGNQEFFVLARKP